VYVDPAAVRPTHLAWGEPLAACVDTLNDTGHSRFLTPDMRRMEQAVSRGTLEGIGAEIRSKGEQITIVAPLDNSPAQQAGLRPGDVILKGQWNRGERSPLGRGRRSYCRAGQYAGHPQYPDASTGDTRNQST